MRRPTDLFDREREWDDLVSFANGPGEGLRLALVRGRRRQGKSFLLRRLADATGGFYHQAVEGERRQALDGLASALGAHLGVPGGRLAFSDWDEAISALHQVAARRRAAPVVVLDELPYLLAHSPELPSVIQRAIERSRDGGQPLRLILCGSALSVMATMLTGSRALRGRATLDLVMRPFDYRIAARYWGIDDPAVAFVVHAVLGGTPGYRDLLTGPPTRVADVPRWLATGPLNPASALFREDDHLLAEDRVLSDRGLYHAVLAAIAGGATSQGQVAAAVGREVRSVQHPLRALEDTGFVTRTGDALRDRRPIYSLADSIVRFHHVVTRRDLARFEDRRTADAWADAQPRFRTHVLGPQFEQVARDFTFRWAAGSTVGGTVSEVAPAVVNDAVERTQHEIDVVALGRSEDGSTTVLALGEAKHTQQRRTIADLDRLGRLRALVAEKHPAAEDAKLLLFSASGFERGLVTASSRRRDVELIDLARLYAGR